MSPSVSLALLAIALASPASGQTLRVVAESVPCTSANCFESISHEAAL